MSGKPRVLNRRDGPGPRDSVYIGRPSKWGNPYRIRPGMPRPEAVERYRLWITHQPELMAVLGELRGKDLVCWCAPEPCHGDVLLELANGEPDMPATIDELRFEDLI